MNTRDGRRARAEREEQQPQMGFKGPEWWDRIVIVILFVGAPLFAVEELREREKSR